MKKYYLDPPRKGDLERKRPQKDKPEPKCPCRKRSASPIVSVLFIAVVAVAAITGVLYAGASQRLLQLELESQLNYAMAKDAKAKLDNLCTHFKTGCTEKYRGR